MAKIVTAKSNLGCDVEQIIPYLSSIDLIDLKLGEFKSKYLELKGKFKPDTHQKSDEKSSPKPSKKDKKKKRKRQ
jgi:hypothetical protein